MRSLSLRLVAALLSLASLTGFSGVSYTKLTDPAAERVFYSTGGKSNRGDRVHLHVKASTILGDADEIVKTTHGGKLWKFRNKTVPLILDPDNVYFRKILQRADAHDRVCVKGEVRSDPTAAGERFAVFVSTLKKAPPPAKVPKTQKKPAAH